MPYPLVLTDSGTETRIFRNRVIASLVIMGVSLLLVIGRLIKLQVFEHDRYKTLSQENRLKIVPVAPARGLIYSHDGVLLADNRPSFSLEVVPERTPDLPKVMRELRELMTIGDDELKTFYRAVRKKRRFEGVSLLSNVGEEDVARFVVDRHRFPGVAIVARLSRYYPRGAQLIHVVGYMGQIDEAETKQLDISNYSATTHIGKTGVEKSYEAVLHGRVGYQEVEVNAEGRVIRVLKRVPSEPGRDLHLSIDTRLQRAALQELGAMRGAVVAADPRTGAVLALVSNPVHDPNVFVSGIGIDEYKALRDSPDRPLFNRALQGMYPPGSTIKPFVALAGLDSGLRTAETASWCPGWYSLAGQRHKYRCWKKAGHGHVDLGRAVAQSCDVYFYRLAHDLEIERLHGYLSRFNFGQPTGIDLPSEASGLLPSPAWKRRSRRLTWYPGETLITGIGQGFVLATPLQLATATAMLANGGRRVTPRVVSHTVDRRAQTSTPVEDPAKAEAPFISAADRQQIVQAMERVVHGSDGTARTVGLDAAFRFAGKTGTAQVFRIKQGQLINNKNVPEHLRDHALFIAFAPVEAPVIVLAIVVEHG
ncbi:MAG: penicillin-binding protein 2, partial [Gammaproteobacteria bacterium]|nr:penicillin-binding protein 2 [Gammaproteobacteria bacterium]